MPKVIFMPSPNEENGALDEPPSRRRWLPWRRRRQQDEPKPQIPTHLVLHPDVEDFLAPWRPTEYPPSYEQAAHQPPSPGSMVHEASYLASISRNPDISTTSEVHIQHGQSPAPVDHQTSRSNEGFPIYEETHGIPIHRPASRGRTEPLGELSATNTTERRERKRGGDESSRHRANPTPPGAHNESDEPEAKQMRFPGDNCSDPVTPQNSPCEAPRLSDSVRQRYEPGPGQTVGSNGNDGFSGNISVHSKDEHLGRPSSRTQKNREGFVYPPDPRMQMWYQTGNQIYM